MLSLSKFALGRNRSLYFAPNQTKKHTFFDSVSISDLSLCIQMIFTPFMCSLPGRRSKGKGKGIRARDHARERTEFPSLLPRAPLAFLSRLTFHFPKLPFPFKRLPRRLFMCFSTKIGKLASTFTLFN